MRLHVVEVYPYGYSSIYRHTCARIQYTKVNTHTHTFTYIHIPLTTFQKECEKYIESEILSARNVSKKKREIE